MLTQFGQIMQQQSSIGRIVDFRPTSNALDVHTADSVDVFHVALIEGALVWVDFTQTQILGRSAKQASEKLLAIINQ